MDLRKKHTFVHFTTFRKLSLRPIESTEGGKIAKDENRKGLLTRMKIWSTSLAVFLSSEKPVRKSKKSALFALRREEYF